MSSEVINGIIRISDAFCTLYLEDILEEITSYAIALVEFGKVEAMFMSGQEAPIIIQDGVVSLAIPEGGWEEVCPENFSSLPFFVRELIRLCDCCTMIFKKVQQVEQ